MKQFTIAILALSLYQLAACQQPANKPAGAVNQVITEAAATYATEIKQPGIQLLDVRTTAEYQGGNIAGSMHADWNDKAEFAKRTAHLDKNKPVYVYCLAGGRSAMAAEQLLNQGFTKVVNLKGGINAWQQAGQPVTPSQRNVKGMTAEEYKAALSSAEWVLVDFGADWCPPCVKIKPAIDSFLTKHPQVKKLLLDPVVNKEMALQNKAATLPTFILYKSGAEVFRREGLFDVAELENALK